jgi:DNA repair photolyase
MSIIYEPAGRAREYAPLAANLYKGCGHACVYCYAAAATRTDRQKFIGDPHPRYKALSELQKDAGKRRGDKTPVLLSFTTDPFQPIEMDHGITREAIKILHANGIPVQILTKGGMRAARDFDLLGQEPGDAFATTLTLLDPAQSLEWEPGAALPDDRIMAIKLAHAHGIKTWVSLEPVIDPAQSLEIIRRTFSFVDLYKVGVLNYHPRAKEIDWKQFGLDAIALLKYHNKEYIIKDDLKKHLDA